jgi:DNA-binding phage protein
MKEAFANVDSLIDQTKLLGDMELQAYLTSLSDSQKNEFITSNVGETIKAVNASKAARFNDLIDQATGADNNIVSAAYYVARTRDLSNLAKEVDTMTVKQLTASEINNGVAGRQNEINEWSNFNKLDTLYVMQVLFISLSLIAILTFLLSNGSIGQTLFAFLSYTIAALAILMLVIRWRYTNVVRDGRYWHKAKFARQPNTFVAPICPGEVS